ncbi:MAG: BMP family ABC transporter substrate-binding protein [Syntrophales bacterium]|nr:BMP family ABC transporter substrate-binding protein [Syntrophales bacterium]
MKKTGMIFSLLVAFAIAFFILPDAFAGQTSPLKVTLVFDVGGRGDGGFNDSAAHGLERAVRELGVKAVYVEPDRGLNRELALNSAAASDADMVIGVSFAFSDKMNELAARYPGKKFVCIDYGVKYDDKGRILPPPGNLAALIFREEEGSYLVGAMAALKSRTGKIGFLGGMDSPIIRRFEAGYQAGAKAVRPDIVVLSKFAGITGKAFNDPQKGYHIATRMYGDGADVIYHAAGATGAGLFKAAGKLNRLAIGVDRDQSLQAPGHVLTSMMKNIDVAVFESIKSSVQGNFSGGLKTFGLKENGVGFVYDERNKGLISADIYNKVLELKRKIIAGEVIVPAAGQDKPMLSEKELTDILVQLRGEITTELNKLDRDIRLGAGKLSAADLKGPRARAVLKDLYGTHPYIIDCETVSDKGIMVAVEPEEHRGSEGADISAQAHMVKLYKTKKPVLSGSFRSVEGPDAVVIHHPVFSPAHHFAGSLSALFAPRFLLSGIIGPVSANLPVDIFLMQTDGLVIYDADTKQIGLNVFSDPFYKPFPQLLALAGKVAAKKEGTGTYRFYQKGTGTPVTEIAYWKTVTLHGTEWRLVITCAEDSIEK